MDMELSSDRSNRQEVSDRAAELTHHTTLSETEAFVYAARHPPEGAAWPHAAISNHIDGGESASQTHLSRANSKATKANATHWLLNRGKRGPRTTKGHTGPVGDDPSELSDEELFCDVLACTEWIERGIETLYGTVDTELHTRQTELRDEIEAREILDKANEYFDTQ